MSGFELEAVADVGWTVGNGRVLAMAERGDLVAVASGFGYLYWPGRAFYDGHRFRVRIVIYEKSTRRRLAVLDDVRHPVNQISFHPHQQHLVVAAGAYDGGWAFEGELVVWRWATGEVHRLVKDREVVRLRWVADDLLLAVARPTDDTQCEAPFETFFETIVDPVHPEAVEVRWRPYDGPVADPEPPGLRDWLDPAPRPPTWDVGLVDGGSVLAVGDRLAEVWDSDLRRRRRLLVEGNAVQVLQLGATTLVHAVHENRSRLYALRRGDLALVRELPRVYLFCEARDCLLGRDALRDGQRADVVLDEGLDVVVERNLGGFDAFNHSLRLGDGLWYLVGGAQPHRDKRLVSFDGGDGRPWDGPAQRMDPTACWSDGRLIAGYREHHPHPGKGDRWIDGGDWKLPVKYAPIALAASGGTVVWATLHGELGALEAATGRVLSRASIVVDGVNTAATCLRFDQDRVIVGTIDGRVLRYRLTR